MYGNTAGLTDTMSPILTLYHHTRGPVHLSKHHHCSRGERQALQMLYMPYYVSNASTAITGTFTVAAIKAYVSPLI